MAVRRRRPRHAGDDGGARILDDCVNGQRGLRASARARIVAAVGGFVLSDLREAEAGQRDYLLTGLDSYLAPVQNVAQSLPRRRDELKQAAGVGSQLGSRMVQLEDLAKQRAGALLQTIEQQRNGALDDASKAAATNRGKEIKDRASEAVNEIRRFNEPSRAARDGAAKVHDRLLIGLISGPT